MRQLLLVVFACLLATSAGAQNTATITVEGDPHQVPETFASRLCGVAIDKVRALPKGQAVCDVDQNTADISTYPGLGAIEADRKRRR